jgi:hypothetical protein
VSRRAVPLKSKTRAFSLGKHAPCPFSLMMVSLHMHQFISGGLIRQRQDFKMY